MLEINNISYSYNGNTEVLKKLCLTVKKGEFLALVGPNGCGKTTLIKLICDLLKIQEGEITLNGVGNNQFTVKNSILYLPSEDILPEFLTGLEYIKLLLKMYKVNLNIQYLNDLIKYYSFESSLDVMIEEYSHGMKKKIQLIAAMLVGPEILIIDETLNGMDVESKEISIMLLEKYSKQGNTIIICSHDLHMLEKVCDRAVILYNGIIHMDNKLNKMEESGILVSVFKELLNHEGVKNEILFSKER